MGGLSAAFYVSYFSTGAIMIMMMTFLVKIFFDSSESDNPLGKVLESSLFRFYEWQGSV